MGGSITPFLGMANVFESASEMISSRLEAAPGAKLPWATVMDMALYTENLGYYRNGVRKIGRGGDFYTSVSVGGLYGELLAFFARRVWENEGKSSVFTIIEQGAHDGSLASDILEAIVSGDEHFANVVQYVIIEPDDGLRSAQAETLKSFKDKISFAAAWHELPADRKAGLFLANELIDAFSLHLIQRVNNQWRELYVVRGESNTLEFAPGDLSHPSLETELADLGTDFAEGHILEINLQAINWVRRVREAGFSGVILLADYGYPQAELFSSDRPQGTLRRYFQHRSDTNVLADLGACDLTAHVNFTRLAVEGQHSGMRVLDFMQQGRFLSHLAVELMQRPGFLPTPAWIRQFHSLTHPHHLGASFQILVMGTAGVSLAGVIPVEHQKAALVRLGLAEE